MTAPLKPAGRTLAEFQPLKPAEQKLLEACRQGVETRISGKRPETANDNDIPPKLITSAAPPDTPTFDPDIHHRRSLRLRHYDYSQAGAYFITICTHNRECLFGNVESDTVLLNDVGRVVQGVWGVLPVNFPGVVLDAFVIMPNHIHGVIVLNDAGAQFIAPDNNQGAINRTPTLGEIIRAFKARCTHGINQLRSTQEMPVWQRNFYEHVIRGESSLREIREYIANNPAQWAFDRENPGAQFVAPNGEGAMNRAPTGLNGVKV